MIPLRYLTQIIIIYSVTLAPFIGLCQPGSQSTVFNEPVKAAVSNQYTDLSLIKRIILGNNYRKIWATPVLLPQFDLNASGLKIVKLGGGRQTKSLQLIDKDSTQWVLRTINKDVSNALSRSYRNKFTVSIAQDMISAAHPYAPLVIPGLAKPTKVAAADPVFFYVPNDPALGEYKDEFAGNICLLEKREILPGDPVTVSTTEMIDEFFRQGYSSVDKQAYGRARLLDMLIADWDRHHDQWIWAEQYRDGNKVYLSLPRDRDQALFYSDGLLVKLVPVLGLRHFVGLQKNTRNIRNLSKKSWGLDQLIFNGLDRKAWQQLVDEFVAALPDTIIEQAVKRLPPEIYSINGEKLQRKLVNRKNTLARDAIQYYDFISSKVVLYGTDQNDRFDIVSGKDSITINIFNNAGQQELKRTIYPGQANEINLLALGGNDSFTITGELPGSIGLKIDGGAGTNVYEVVPGSNITTLDSEMTAASYRPLLHEKLRIRPEQ